MTALIPITRKRSRSAEEEDFLPLSKKINNLHIHQWNALKKGNHVTNDYLVQNWNNPPSNWPLPSECVPIAPVEKQQSPQSWPPPYSPELTAEQNPFYYESNRLMFELYLSRVHRTSY